MTSAPAPTFRDILASLPAEYRADNGFLLESFLDWARLKGLSLYPAQEAAVLELF